MRQYPEFQCNNVAEVQEATKNLDKARMCDLKIDDGGVIKDIKNFKGIYNVSKGAFCAAVVPYYNLVQHKEYFDSFAQALDKLGVKYSMIIRQIGNRAFADIEFSGRNLKFDKLGEEFTTGIRLINSYDKTMGLYAVPRFTRLICDNGMVITRDEKTVSIKHHSKIVKELEGFIEKRINAIVSKNDDLKEWVGNSMKDSEEWLTCCYILEKLFTQPKHREEILKRLGISMISVADKKDPKKKNVSYVWDQEDKKKNKINRWDLYNAVTHYLTHGEQITPHIDNLFQRQAERLLMTPLAKLPRIEKVLTA